jgi:hypothetical protein
MVIDVSCHGCVFGTVVLVFVMVMAESKLVGAVMNEWLNEAMAGD